ncbi:Agouti-signaling protein [Dissostichus eleginoides]|uniref:Agouti-signaling protein n=1 Tax=Dissostichus eleginoides TaxID=100907 RepID=A0AAD9BSC9_DISEL|nr:Agouti-signaling protein [Dissostichus eleginoides]
MVPYLRAGAEQDKSKGVGYNGSEKEEYGSRAIRGLTPDLCPPVGSQDYCNSPAPLAASQLDHSMYS